MKTFNIWKTITLGLHNDADSYRSAIKKFGFQISDGANDILGKSAFTVTPTKETIDLVVVSVADLGFKNGATYKEICDAALNQGLSLVLAEVGPALRLQYKEGQKGESLYIAMEPISDSDGCLRILDVVYDFGDLWLLTYYGRSHYGWGAGARFVFCLRK